MVHADHSPADVVGCLQLPDGIADDGAQPVRRTGHCQGDPCQEKMGAQAKNDRCQPEDKHCPKKEKSLPAQFMHL